MRSMQRIFRMHEQESYRSYIVVVHYVYALPHTKKKAANREGTVKESFTGDVHNLFPELT